uniref:UBC core domain-containing protein n=1 Tax=Arcella intermedia TaxID=1963864 RepID=A0A6B2LM88_9EUKA
MEEVMRTWGKPWNPEDDAGRGGRERVEMDVRDLPEEPWFEVRSVDGDGSLKEIVVWPPEGYWEGASVKFSCTFPRDYPYSPPRVRCTTRVFHPSIDMQGYVSCWVFSLGDWSCERTLTDVVFGLLNLFIYPHTDGPMNFAASDLLDKDPQQFQEMVHRIQRGNQH